MKNTFKYNRLFKPPTTSFFLLGLRGTGKSTLIADGLPSAKTISLLKESTYQLYLQRPEAFAEDLAQLKSGQWVVLDEVQRLPQLLNEVHSLIEERHLRFALVGSSARKLRREGVNLLGGRALLRHLHPLLPEELGDDCDVQRILRFGSIPLIWMSADPKDQLQAYMQLYFKEEIQAEAVVRNLPGFARFLPVVALFHGQVMNVEALARDAGVARTTVDGYLKILEDTLVAFFVPAYEKKLRVRQRKHPKLFWSDSGLVRAAKSQLSEVTIEEKGALFEGFIAQVLRAYHELKLIEYDQLSYWSSGKSSIEVDFLLERGKECVGIEVKSGTSPSLDWFSGLSALKDAGVIRRGIVVHLGQRSYTHSSGIEVMALSAFLEKIRNL